MEFDRVHATALADVAHFKSQLGEGHKQVVADIDLPQVLIPAARLSDLTPAEITERAQASELVQRSKAEAEQLSLIVFGSSPAISDVLSRIDGNPALASAIASDLKSEPGQFGALAGAPGGWIRRASQERQNAEANLPRLATAIDDYGSAVR
ncbi:BID domain-containing T4SS effector [Brucella pseudogrignonensis]|uniref:BID domain-containing T4SS effector n=1 Tax=Brucella pseudogrignonensis TaxID=419475 RepID=UPI0038CF9286